MANESKNAARASANRKGKDDVEFDRSWEVQRFLDQHAKRFFKSTRKRLSDPVAVAFSLAQEALERAAELHRVDKIIKTGMRRCDRVLANIERHIEAGIPETKFAEMRLDVEHTRTRLLAMGNAERRLADLNAAGDLISGFASTDDKRLELKGVIERAANWEKKERMQLGIGQAPDLRRVPRGQRGDIAHATVAALAVILQIDKFAPEEIPRGQLNAAIRAAIDAWKDERRGSGHKKDMKKFDGLNALLTLIGLGVKDGKTLRDSLNRKQRAQPRQR